MLSHTQDPEVTVRYIRAHNDWGNTENEQTNLNCGHE